MFLAYKQGKLRSHSYSWTFKYMVTSKKQFETANNTEQIVYGQIIEFTKQTRFLLGINVHCKLFKHSPIDLGTKKLE